jgi:hypothetical protein
MKRLMLTIAVLAGFVISGNVEAETRSTSGSGLLTTTPAMKKINKPETTKRGTSKKRKKELSQQEKNRLNVKGRSLNKNELKAASTSKLAK